MHIAIVGCGQLSQMLAQAGIPLGHSFSFLADPDEDTRCVDDLGTVIRWQADKPTEQLYSELGLPECLTVEKEQVDVALIEAFQPYCPVHPNPKAFAACQHRHNEKQLLAKLEIPSSPYIYGQPTDAIAEGISLPVVVKSCRFGYDGKNQWVLKTQQDVEDFKNVAEEDAYIVEQWIPFDREISQVSVRGTDGEIRHYPLVQNHHDKGILKQTIAPAAEVSEQLKSAAQDYMQRLMETLDYVGVMAMECFVIGDGLMVNELAPRVHNSGHWTQAGQVTSQFENHIRAIAKESLGSTESQGVTGMINLIGIEKPSLEDTSVEANLHWYGKVVRSGRKLGHINIESESYESLSNKIESLAAITKSA